MNNLVKVVFLKELKENLNDWKFVVSTIVITIISTLVGIASYDSLNSETQHLAYIIIILIPSLTMWIVSFPLIEEKFLKDKSLNSFQSLLTLPLSLRDVWMGKITSIFVLSYPSALVIAVILATAYFLIIGPHLFIHIPFTVWIFSFIIGPMLIMVHISISSLITLRFTNPKVNNLLLYVSELIFMLIIMGIIVMGGNISSNSFMIDWTMIIGGLLIIGISMGLVYHTISNIKKENVI